MARPFIAPLAPQIVLHSGYTVKLLALDPTTGSNVAGVTVSSVAMQVNVADPDEENTPLFVSPIFAYGTNE